MKSGFAQFEGILIIAHWPNFACTIISAILVYRSKNGESATHEFYIENAVTEQRFTAPFCPSRCIRNH